MVLDELENYKVINSISKKIKKISLLIENILAWMGQYGEYQELN